MDNITVRNTTAPVECTERPIFRRSSHDLAADTAGGADAEQTPVRSRPGRQGVLFLATCLMVVVASFGTLVTSAAPASAVVTQSSASCNLGWVSTSARIRADAPVQYGPNGAGLGQYVSVLYRFSNPRTGWETNTGWQPYFFAPYNSTNVQWGKFWTGLYASTSLTMQVAYWNGYAWTVNTQRTSIDVVGCHN